MPVVPYRGNRSLEGSVALASDVPDLRVRYGGGRACGGLACGARAGRSCRRILFRRPSRGGREGPRLGRGGAVRRCLPEVDAQRAVLLLGCRCRVPFDRTGPVAARAGGGACARRREGGARRGAGGLRGGSRLRGGGLGGRSPCDGRRCVASAGVRFGCVVGRRRFEGAPLQSGSRWRADGEASSSVRASMGSRPLRFGDRRRLPGGDRMRARSCRASRCSAASPGRPLRSSRMCWPRRSRSSLPWEGVPMLLLLLGKAFFRSGFLRSG